MGRGVLGTRPCRRRAAAAAPAAGGVAALPACCWWRSSRRRRHRPAWLLCCSPPGAGEQRHGVNNTGMPACISLQQCMPDSSAAPFFSTSQQKARKVGSGNRKWDAGNYSSTTPAADE